MPSPTTVGVDKTNNNYSWVNNIGNNLISNISFEVGGNVLDKYYSDYQLLHDNYSDNSNKNGSIVILVTILKNK